MGRNLEFIEDEAVLKAMNLFWEKGYNGANMRDLVEVMGINSSSLYRSIGNKQQLFIKCIDRYAGYKVSAIIDSVKGIDSPLQAITRLVNDSVDVIIKSENSCLSIKTAFELGSGDEEVFEVLKRHNGTYYTMLLNLVQQAIALNEIKQIADPETIADYIFNSFTGWHESFIFNSDPIKIKKMAEFLLWQIRTG